MYTRSFFKKIYSQIDSNLFSPDDFRIYPAESGRVVVEYVHNGDFNFSFLPLENDNYDLVFSPGSIKLVEQLYGIPKLDGVFYYIGQWVENLSLEIESIPYIKMIDSFKNEVNERLDSLKEELTENYFTKVEANDLIEKINTLTKLYEELLKENEELQDLYENQFSQFNKEMEFLKQQILGDTKRVWYSKLLTKLLRFINDNPKLAGTLAKTVREILPEEVKNLLPFNNENVS